MSEKYKIKDQERPYFVTFATEGWVDVFTRAEYRDIVIESLKFCQQQKGLVLYAWCLMSNHIHMIIGSKGGHKIEDIVRDFKKYTSVHICKAIENNNRESRKEWMLGVFAKAGQESSKHTKYKFWQNEYHPVELFYPEMAKQKLDYLHNNPTKEGLVDHAEDYRFSSARDYSGIKGLLEVEFSHTVVCGSQTTSLKLRSVSHRPWIRVVVFKE